MFTGPRASRACNAVSEQTGRRLCPGGESGFLVTGCFMGGIGRDEK